MLAKSRYSDHLQYFCFGFHVSRVKTTGFPVLRIGSINRSRGHILIVWFRLSVKVIGNNSVDAGLISFIARIESLRWTGLCKSCVQFSKFRILYSKLVRVKVAFNPIFKKPWQCRTNCQIFGIFAGLGCQLRLVHERCEQDLNILIRCIYNMLWSLAATLTTKSAGCGRRHPLENRTNTKAISEQLALAARAAGFLQVRCESRAGAASRIGPSRRLGMDRAHRHAVTAAASAQARECNS